MVCIYTSVLWLTDWLGLKIKPYKIMNFSSYFLSYCLVCNGVHPCCPTYGRSTQWKYFDYCLLLYFLSIDQVLSHLDVSLKLINGMKFHLLLIVILKPLDWGNWFFFFHVKLWTVEDQLLTAKEKEMHIFVLTYWHSNVIVQNKCAIALWTRGIISTS